MEKETIAAIATPFGSGGIGIIRISGSQATNIAGRLFRHTRTRPSPQNSRLLDELLSHHLTHGYIVDENHIVDEVLLAVMKAPHSYTKEDVVEIQSHSGVLILRRILQLILEKGARLAEPGEFTRRAFLNGRIDLSQAEAVADVIAAKSEASLQISTTQLMGAMRKEVESFIAQLKNILAQLEAQIEFGDEIEATIERQNLARQLNDEVLKPTRLLVSQYEEGHFFRDGVRLDIVGRPNVGKSSLLNRLLKKDKAIVTEIPGTTRDLIEDHFSIAGIPILITDTAGLHATDNPVEKIGIIKTHHNIDRSDLVLFVVDGSNVIGDADLEIYQKIRAKKVVLVINKIDLVGAGQEMSIPDAYHGIKKVMVCALNGDGIEDLKKAVVQVCDGGIEIDPGRTIIPNLRQKAALDLAAGCLENALTGLYGDGAEELIVDDLYSALSALSQIIGRKVESDVLDDIFNQFCIGK